MSKLEGGEGRVPTGSSEGAGHFPLEYFPPRHSPGYEYCTVLSRQEGHKPAYSPSSAEAAWLRRVLK